MKRFFAQLKKLNVRRAVLSKTAARVFVGVIACLLWDRFLNSAGRLSVLGHAFMAVGLLFAAFAWMHYMCGSCRRFVCSCTVPYTASFIISKDRERPCHPCSQKVSASTPARREECP